MNACTDLDAVLAILPALDKPTALRCRIRTADITTIVDENVVRDRAQAEEGRRSRYCGISAEQDYRIG